MHLLHPDQELGIFALRQRRDVAAAEHRRLVRAHATATASPTSVVTWLRRTWADLVGVRPHRAACPPTPSAGHAVTPTRT